MTAHPADLLFEVFTRAQWAAFGSPTQSGLSVTDVASLVATGDPVSLDEVTDIYVPLAQLLTVHAAAARDVHRRVGTFLGEPKPPSPFVIGIAGSVAVGKSTTARILQALLRSSAGSPTVALVTTDGFLHPNATLEARGLMERKGFPESYDQRRLIEALSAMKSGSGAVAIPVYSHVTYDIVPGEFQIVDHPEMVIFEGLNVLQVSTDVDARNHVVASDFFDFSIYVDAAEDDIARWFTDRLLELQATILRQPNAYFHAFATMSEDEVSAVAQQVWADINLVNLHQNIAPSARRAHLVLEKDGDHRVQRTKLRKL